METELKELLKKALKDASGDTFYKLDRKTFMPKVFDVYCEQWFEDNAELIAKAAASLCREREKSKNETLSKIRWALSRRETFDVIHKEIAELLNNAGFPYEPED